MRVSKHARKELEGYLDCGLLCRGFARLVCEACGESRVVAWSCSSWDLTQIGEPLPGVLMQ